MIELKSIRAVVLDADDTLFHVRGSLAGIYCDYFTQHGIDTTEEQLSRAIPEIWATFRAEYRNEDNDYVTSPAREKAMWKNFVTLVANSFQSIEDIDPLFEDLYHEFARGRSRKLFDGALEFLRALNTRGHCTGLLSNNDGRLKRVVDELEITHLFDHILPTAEIGFKKPSVKCFSAVAEILQCEPNKIVHIGNEYENDYLAPRNADWQSILFNPSNRVYPNDVYSVSSYQELIKLFTA